MKKSLVVIACAALMVSCGGNNVKSGDSDARKTGCVECSGKHEHDACATAGVIKISSEEFVAKVADTGKAWKYLGDKPAIVDFYADWCQPCRMIAPILEEIAKENPDIYVYKVNIDDCPDVAEAYNVVSIPTLLFIPMEGEPKREVGAMTKGQFEKIIKEDLLK